jgi:hypothetical protein
VLARVLFRNAERVGEFVEAEKVCGGHLIEKSMRRNVTQGSGASGDACSLGRPSRRWHPKQQQTAHPPIQSTKLWAADTALRRLGNVDPPRRLACPASSGRPPSDAAVRFACIWPEEAVVPTPKIRLWRKRGSPERRNLTDAERTKLWEQFVGVYAEAQQVFDSSIRTLAAAGIALTVSLATALKVHLNGAGIYAIYLFVASLFCNVVSYATAQRDMTKRLDCLTREDPTGVDGNEWTTFTTVLNIGQGLAVTAGGALLAWYIKSKAA